MKARAIIADDEPLARQKLLRSPAPGRLDRVRGRNRRRPIDDRAASIASSPIWRSSISACPAPPASKSWSATRHRPHVIFTTAFDEYAVTAFELQAVDYLLKPFGAERFERAIERARQHLQMAGEQTAQEPSLDTEPDVLERAQQSSGPLSRLFIRERGRIAPVAVETIERLEALDDYVAVHTADRRHLVGVRLRDFEARLDPACFMRIHRSHIVNLTHITAIERHDSTRLKVVLESGTEIIASRAGSKRLRERSLC